MQSMLFVRNLQIINIIETSNHCFLLKNKENDMTGIVQLKVKSLKLHGYAIYYNFSSLRTSLFYKLSRQEIIRKYYYANPLPTSAYNITKHSCLITYNLYFHSVCNSHFYGFNNRNTFT